MYYLLTLLIVSAWARTIYGIQLPNGSVYVGPHEGDRFQPYPMVGTSRTYKLRGSDNEQSFVLMDGHILINETSQLHLHEREGETFRVLSGALQLLIGNETFCALADTVVYAPRNTLMAFRNPYASDTKVEFLFTPAGIEYYFDEVNSILTGNTTNITAQLEAAAAKYGLALFGTPDWKDIDCGKSLSSKNLAFILHAGLLTHCFIILAAIILFAPLSLS